MKVLIAEDSQIMRKIIKANLNKLSVTKIYEAVDGEAAFNILIANPKIDLVFTDLNMPLMNGLDLCKKIRAESRFANLKIIVISEFLNEVVKDSFLTIGVSGFIPKPFDLKAFNEVATPIIDSVTSGTEVGSAFSKAELIKKINDDIPMMSLTMDGLFIEFSGVNIKIPIDKILEVAQVKQDDKSPDTVELDDK